MSSLFEVLQSYQNPGFDQKKPIFQAVIDTDLPPPAPPSFTLIHESDKPSKSDRRHVLHGTSRLAFGNGAELSDMFQKKALASKGSKATTPMDVDELPVENLKLSGSIESEKLATTSSSSNKSSGKQSAPPSTDTKLNGNFPNKKPSGNATINTSKPKPTGSSTAIKPLPSKPSSSAPNTAANNQHGKAAAMAKMASLGEEWPEEEELPGMSLPVANSLNKVGDLNKDAMKQMHNSVQRQKKVIIAKKKS